MDFEQQDRNHTVNPRRPKRSQVQFFKETYLPVIIAGLSLLLIIIFIIGSITRKIQRSEKEQEANVNASIESSALLQALEDEANDLYNRASAHFEAFNYESALEVINSFSGNISDFPKLSELRTACEDALNSMVLWSDPSEVINLSFQLLIEDPTRAFADKKYGKSYNKNFITTDEFHLILQQLYENGYILVDIDTVVAQPMQLYLPEGKKPLVLTQTQVNYYRYMVDSNSDGMPDAGGAGFASKLILDANGNLTCEMVDKDGQTVIGAYDFVPILESFITTHPDFSYQGARAILAVTGYDGLFGYRTNSGAKQSGHYEQDVNDAKKITAALRDAGYKIACYSYDNVGYGKISTTSIRSDLESWNQEVAPILGVVDTLVYAQESDIANTNSKYTGEKFSLLNEFGFTTYIGFASNGKSWCYTEDTYTRYGRIMVSGSTLAHHPEWFTDILEPESILDSTRGAIPS